MTIFFIIILGAILLYKYKGKLTPSEKEMKNREKQQYILCKNLVKYIIYIININFEQV